MSVFRQTRPQPVVSTLAARPGSSAFARCDVLALVAALLLAGLVALPTLAYTRHGSAQAWCMDNLRQVGRAFHLWGKDHGAFLPWRIPTPGGGTQGPHAGNAWYEFAWVSNELVTPRILACPSDAGRRQAMDFSTRSDGGFLNASYRNNAVSYWIGLDAGYVSGNIVSIEVAPEHLLCGDRNLRVDAINGSCSSGVNNAASVWARGSSRVAWTNGLHGVVGNVLANDGRVEPAHNLRLQKRFASSDDNGSVHLLIP